MHNMQLLSPGVPLSNQITTVADEADLLWLRNQVHRWGIVSKFNVVLSHDRRKHLGYTQAHTSMNHVSKRSSNFYAEILHIFF